MKLYIYRTQTIMDGLVLRWTPRWPWAGLTPEISASRNAVMVSGLWEFRDSIALAAFTVAIVQAMAIRSILGRGQMPQRLECEIDVGFGEDVQTVIARTEAS